MGPTWVPHGEWARRDLKIDLGPSYVQKLAPFNDPIISIRAYKFSDVQPICMVVQVIQRCTVHSHGSKSVRPLNYRGWGFWSTRIDRRWAPHVRASLLYTWAKVRILIYIYNVMWITPYFLFFCSLCFITGGSIIMSFYKESHMGIFKWDKRKN